MKISMLPGSAPRRHSLRQELKAEASALGHCQVLGGETRTPGVAAEPSLDSLLPSDAEAMGGHMWPWLLVCLLSQNTSSTEARVTRACPPSAATPLLWVITVPRA